MFCHGLFKRYVGHNQKLNIFVWGMRSIVIVLNLFPIYLMNNVSDLSHGESESLAPSFGNMPPYA
jgi:hypothetical protein